MQQNFFGDGRFTCIGCEMIAKVLRLLTSLLKLPPLIRSVPFSPQEDS